MDIEVNVRLMPFAYMEKSTNIVPIGGHLSLIALHVNVNKSQPIQIYPTECGTFRMYQQKYSSTQTHTNKVVIQENRNVYHNIVI